MKKHPVVLLALLTTLVLSACTTPLSPEARSRIKRIGVISVGNETIRGNYTGVTAFGNEEYDEPAPSFAIDAMIEAESTRVLSQGGGFSAIALPQERATIKRSSKVPLMRESVTVDATRIPEIARRHKLDAVLTWWPSVINDGPTHLRGVTLGSATFGGKKVYAITRLQGKLYDGNTGEPLVATLGVGRLDGPMEITRADGAPVIWQKSLSAYSPEDLAAIRTEVRRRTEAAVRDGLDHTGMDHR